MICVKKHVANKYTIAEICDDSQIVNCKPVDAPDGEGDVRKVTRGELLDCWQIVKEKQPQDCTIVPLPRARCEEGRSMRG